LGGRRAAPPGKIGDIRNRENADEGKLGPGMPDE
jgi:hypothetical protein